MNQGLTIEDIHALRDAHKISLQSYVGNKSVITCFVNDEVYHSVLVHHVILDNEGGDLPDYAGLVMEDTQEEAVWRSILAILEEGDVLTLRWCRGTYTTPDMLSYDLMGDGVEIEIESASRHLVFVLLLHVAPRESTNRIFRFREDG